jgi:hypothetical protein
MHLKLEELQRVAKKTIKEEHRLKGFRDELFRVFGPPVMVSTNYEKVAEAANEQLDIMEATGRGIDRSEFKVAVLVEAATNKSAGVRKLAARLLPERLAAKLLSDPSSSVRCAAAKRLPYSLVKEAVRRNPGDDQLRTIVRNKRLREAGLPNAKPVTEPFDIHGDGPLGDAAKTQSPLDDMPDTWYERLAHKLCSQYGTNLEGQWEEILATRIVASHFSTTGVKLDRDKLLKAIYDCIKEREDKVIEEGSLSAIVRRLRKESLLEEAVMPVLDEERNDPIADLLESSMSSSAFVEAAEKLFSVRKSTVPAGIKKYRIGEGHQAETHVPVKGHVPNGGHVTAKVEQALDSYVSHWNNQQSLRGEPYRLSWSPSPMGIDLVGFHLVLK